MAEIRQTLRLTDLNLDEANFVLGQIQDRLDEIEGRRGTPTFKGNIDMGGYQVTNVGAASLGNDAVTKGEIDAIIETVWPVGSIYTSVVETNPGSLLGFGTWESFGAGKFLVGIDSADADFDIVEETGGAKTKDISHTHDMGDHTHPIDHTHGVGTSGGTGAKSWSFTGDSGIPSTNTTGSGGGVAQDILPPYKVVYFWKRIS